MNIVKKKMMAKKYEVIREGKKVELEEEERIGK